MVIWAGHDAQASEELQMKVWVFRFSYVADSMRSKWTTGVPHATELPYVFGMVKAKYGAATMAADEKASDAILTYYANYAKTGDPDGAGMPEWPKFDPAKDNLMNFTMDQGRWRCRTRMTRG